MWLFDKRVKVKYTLPTINAIKDSLCIRLIIAQPNQSLPNQTKPNLTYPNLT